MTEHFDLDEAAPSTYSTKDVTLSLFAPEPVADDALKVVCPPCLASHRVESPGSGNPGSWG